MKPRTRIERQVVELSGKLPAISEAQKKWAFSLFPVKGFYLKKGEVWCQCCGHLEKVLIPVLEVSLQVGSHICPKCGKPLRLVHLFDGACKDEMHIVSFLTCYKGWNVIRTFQAERNNRDKGVPTEYSIDEIYQNWFDEKGKEVILTRPYSRSPFHLSWKTWEPMQVGHHNHSCGGYYEMEDMFDTHGNYFYNRASVTGILKRNGWSNRFMKMDISVSDAVRQLLSNPFAETLVKQGQYEVFKYMLKKGNYQLPYRHALNICHRNGYVIKDASMWFDYLDLLTYFNRDTHNAHYVCPENLNAEHDRLMKLKDSIEKKKSEKSRMEMMKRENEAYRKAKSSFFGIVFDDGTIHISVLQDIQEFYDEAQEMHHCVYINKYYLRDKSLILSAKVDGKRIETVEVDLKKFNIVQSRAVCNGTSRYHNRIIELVNRNMDLIRRAAI